jgi:hypothetical protein
LHQQTELVAIIVDIDSEYQRWRLEAPRLVRFRKMSKRGPAHVRMIGNKIVKVRSALEDLSASIHKLDPAIDERVGPSIQTALRAVDQMQTALIGPRETLAEYTGRMRDSYERALSYMSQTAPTATAAKRLVVYFGDTASKTLDDSHVRTAKIGNARWGWRYAIRRKYDGLECPGLRKLLARFQRKSAVPPSQSPPSHQRTAKKKPR